ncbi:5-carboxymethyl-2-oxo-hex-3- ene-1,7-dioate decarboxylase [Klebsiella pneumoniae]|uniref:5-carboxymethyl-2-oxo-hex-3- ene-1,7-dioate decarboxylase n=1 Tax=Klebsiella pneumoniae TaxID=573 RepID=A0A447RYJ7_KLEPN|nr:5-carboxymethyl-2-oxo-hex-3- ene-1,7-dioate decarboxylase [Klebsiella pneumoniae]
MHYEAELVVVIGKTARRVSEAEAMDYVASYTLCNDYAIRGLSGKTTTARTCG